MKKLLVGTAAIALVLAMSAPANAAADANGVKLSVGGYFKGYVAWVDQDEDTTVTTSVRDFDILRDTQVHLTGETTLDNGLTVGFHTEALADGSGTGLANDSFDVKESYAYFSGAWGRFNFGAEDGAAYLLQVAAPSADANVDGLRQYVQPVNYAATIAGVNAGVLLGAWPVGAAGTGDGFDYDQDNSGFNDKITYLSPVFQGFQAGVSYTPDVSTGAGAGVHGLNGVVLDNVADTFGDAWDVALRYEGQFDQVGVTLGAGYTDVELQNDDNGGVPDGTNDDDRQSWNGGVNFKWGAFNLGGAYMNDDNGFQLDNDTDTWVVGLDYTTGPFKLGASYFDVSQEADGWAGAVNSGDIDTHRWTGGVVYTYGPGMTFRGSLSYIDHNFDAQLAEQDTNATSLLVGTQINF